ncbi:hypothetical protein DL768_011450 [Monosporascus sp. mg162]|nr:hypothetical protein DL768_011450 [Monosporascus sp. mg162]
MADNFNYNELKDRTLVLNAKILTPPGHNPHPNSRIDFDAQKETNVARAFALGNLQKTGTTVVDEETLRRPLLDTIGTYNADLRTKRLSTLMIVPIDQVWVLIVVQIRHDPDKPAPVADGEQSEAMRVVIYDVVEAGQAHREQIIRYRMRRVLQEGDITLPAGCLEVMYDLPMVEAYHSGLIIHEIASRLMERLDAELARVRHQNPAATVNDIHVATHAATPPSAFDTSMEMDSDEYGDDDGGDDVLQMVDLTEAARDVTLSMNPQ